MQELLNKITKTLTYHVRRMSILLRGIWWIIAKPKTSAPVFIVGCSRAGTTLVYKTFSEASVLGSLQKETHDFWAKLHPLEERNWESHALSAEDASDSDRAKVSRHFYIHTGKHRFVDKNNQNGLCISYLYRLFPNAYFVYVRRSPGDNINSLMEGWRQPDVFATWSNDLPEKVCIDGGSISRWCFFLPPGWKSYLDSTLEKVCTFQYQAMNEAILDTKSQIPDKQWIDIRYEDLLADPVNGFRQAFEKCGIDFTPAMERHCESVLAKPYNAFSEIGLEKWRRGRNSNRLGKILPSVNKLASRMGYPEMN